MHVAILDGQIVLSEKHGEEGTNFGFDYQSIYGLSSAVNLLKSFRQLIRMAEVPHYHIASTLG